MSGNDNEIHRIVIEAFGDLGVAENVKQIVADAVAEKLQRVLRIRVDD